MKFRKIGKSEISDKKSSIIVAPLISNRTASVDDALYLIKSNQICLVDIEGAVDPSERVASTRFK